MQVWERLAEGCSQAATARKFKLHETSLTAIVKQTSYVDWFDDIDPKTYSQAVKNMKKRSNPTVRQEEPSECRPAVPWLSWAKAKEAIA
jgi:hypothetical protein